MENNEHGGDGGSYLEQIQGGSPKKEIPKEQLLKWEEDIAGCFDLWVEVDITRLREIIQEIHNHG